MLHNDTNDKHDTIDLRYELNSTPCEHSRQTNDLMPFYTDDGDVHDEKEVDEGWLSPVALAIISARLDPALTISNRERLFSYFQSRLHYRSLPFLDLHACIR